MNTETVFAAAVPTILKTTSVFKSCGAIECSHEKCGFWISVETEKGQVCLEPPTQFLIEPEVIRAYEERQKELREKQVDAAITAFIQFDGEAFKVEVTPERIKHFVNSPPARRDMGRVVDAVNAVNAVRL